MKRSEEPMPEIETSRLRCRMPSLSDLDALLLMFSDPNVTKYLGIEAGTVLSREETKATLEKMIEFWRQHGFGRWAVVNKEGGELIGLCGFRLLDDGTPELFYAFSSASWGKGLATEAAKAVLRYGFEELGAERVVAFTRHGNTASIGVMKKIGMKYEKEVTHYGVDAVCYAARRDEYQVDHSPYMFSRA